MAEKKKTYTAADVRKAVQRKFSDTNRYVVLEEVNQGTGSLGRSWIDMLVVSLWPSDGLIRKAIEVKVSRQDFLSEMANTKKNQFFKNCCHEFWYVTPQGVVKSEDEIPEGCGWMCLWGNGLSIKKQAKRKDEPSNDDAFVAAIVRSAVKALDSYQISMKNELLESDHRYKRWIATEKAVRRFLVENGVDVWRFGMDEDEDEILKMLMESISDKKDNKDRKQIERKLEDIRDNFSNFFIRMFLLSQHLLTEVGEDGNFLLGEYGIRGRKSDREIWSLLHGFTKRLKNRHSNKADVKSELKFFKEFLKEVVTAYENPTKSK